MFKQRITPFRIENTQGNVAFSLKSSLPLGVGRLNEKRWKTYRIA
jgi:hypothetical protein